MKGNYVPKKNGKLTVDIAQQRKNIVFAELHGQVKRRVSLKKGKKNKIIITINNFK